MRTAPASSAASTAMVPPAGVNFTAFVRRFHTTCCRRAGSPYIGEVTRIDHETRSDLLSAAGRTASIAAATTRCRSIGLDVETQLARRDARHVEVLDQSRLHFRISLDHLECVRLPRFVQGAEPQHPAPAENRVQRRAQLVRQGRQELVLRAVRRFRGCSRRPFLAMRAPQLRHVAEDEHDMFFNGWFTLLWTLVVGIAVYAALIVFLWVSGKRTLAKMNAFDLIVTVSLGSTLATITLSADIALAQGALALALLIALQMAITWSSVRWGWVRRAVTGEPSLLLFRGRYLQDALRRARVTEAEVRAAVRSQGLAALEEVEAVVENNGTFSVIARGSDQPSSTLAGIKNPAADATTDTFTRERRNHVPLRRVAVHWAAWH